MMKLISKACIALATLCFVSTSFAETVTNKFFTVDLPAKWEQRAQPSKDGVNIGIMNKEKFVAIFIVVQTNINPDLKLTAEQTAEKLKTQGKAKDVTLDEQDGIYIVNANLNNMYTRYYFGSNGKDLSSIMIGAEKNIEDGMEVIKALKANKGYEKLFPKF